MCSLDGGLRSLSALVLSDFFLLLPAKEGVFLAVCVKIIKKL